MNSVDAIAQAFRKQLAEGHLADPETYYTVQRGCVSLLKGASSRGKIALYCAASLAERMAYELRDEAILAEDKGNWQAYADALERVIRLTNSEISAQEFVWALANSIATIFPPQGHP